jgi:hypothetical protein
MIVGTAQVAGANRAFVWTAAGGFVQLPIIPGSFSTAANDVTRDGTAIIGASGLLPVRWRRTGASWVIEQLLVPVGASYASGEHGSADGSIVVGRDSSNRVCVWGRSGEPAVLSTLLLAHSVPVDGTLVRASSISDDGTIIVGELRRPDFKYRGWVLTNLPPICGSADFNHDADVGTDADIEAYFACLAGHCCATCGTADFNGDGDFGTDQDIEAFFRVLTGAPC